MTGSRRGRGRLRLPIPLGPNKLVALLAGIGYVGLVWWASGDVSLVLLAAGIGLLGGVLGWWVAAQRRVIVDSVRAGTGRPAPSPRPKPSRPHAPTSRTSPDRVSQAASQLWSGYREVGLGRLHHISEDRRSTPSERGRAHLELSMWYLADREVDRALSHAVLARVAQPKGGSFSDAQAVVEADALLAAGRATEAVRLLVEEIRPGHLSVHEKLRLANAELHRSGTGDAAGQRLSILNRVLDEHGFAPIGLRDVDQPLGFGNLMTVGAEPVLAGALVTVIMPAYNAEDRIDVALGSLVGQTWRALEIIVVDDASTDRTAATVAAWAEKDQRVRLLRSPENGGTYAARNLGLAAARGTFVTVHDADDWSHAQKIEAQVRPLLENEALAATISHCARADEGLVFQVPSGRPTRRRVFGNRSSLMFRREVAASIGVWHRIRAAADAEFLDRIEAVYGTDAVLWVEPAVPLSFALVEPGSLTKSSTTGLDSLQPLLGARRIYRDSFERWHRSTAMVRDLPLQADHDPSSPFPVPSALLRGLGDGGSPLDIVVLADLRATSPTVGRVVDQARVHAAAGLMTGLVHNPPPDRSFAEPIAPEVWDLLGDPSVRLLTADERVTCRFMVVHAATAWDPLLEVLPEVRSDVVALVVGGRTEEPDEDAAGDGLPGQVHLVDALRARFSGNVRVCQGGGATRSVAGLEVGSMGPAWVEFVTPVAGRPDRDRVGDPVRIGRDGSPHAADWPASRIDLLGAYPEGEDFEVRVLGTADPVRDRFEGLPHNWVEEDLRQRPRRVVVAELDFFVQVGRSPTDVPLRPVLEAMAAGVAVVVPEGALPVLGDHVARCRPAEVRGVIDDLARDPSRYADLVGGAKTFVEQRFAPSAYGRWLASLGVDWIPSESIT